MNFLKKLFVWAAGESDTGYKVADEIEWPKAPVDKEAEEAARIKIIQEQIDELNANDEKFEVGDFVRYTKIPNDIIMGVSEYLPYRINFYPGIRIVPSRIAAQYFVDGELKTIVDSPNWFEKVERE